VDYTEAPSFANETTQPFTKYDTTTVIVHVRDNVTGHEWKAMYYPRVDEFSQLELAGTFSTSMTFNPNVTLWVEFQNRTTTPKHVFRYADSEAGLLEVFIPYFVAVVLLDKGYVTDVTWQDGCANGCRDKYCLDDQCGNEHTNDICDKMNCNLKVFFAYSGRDGADNACRSIASTPERFQQYSLTPTANFGNGLWDDFLSNTVSTAPNPIDQAA